MNNTPADDGGGGAEWADEWRVEHEEDRSSEAWEAHYNEEDGQYYWRLKQRDEASSSASQETHAHSDHDKVRETSSAFWTSTFVPTTDGLVGVNGTTSVSICAPLPGPSSSVRVTRVFGQARTDGESNGTKKNAAVAGECDQELPPHVSKIYDDEAGHFYFYNSETGESSWDFPADSANPTSDDGPSLHHNHHPHYCNQLARDSTVELSEQSTCLSIEHEATHSRLSFEIQRDCSGLGRRTGGGTSASANDGSGTLRLELNGILENVALNGAVCGDGAFRVDMYSGKPGAATCADRFQSPLVSLHLTRGSGRGASLAATTTLTTCLTGNERVSADGNSFAWCRDVLLGAHLSWSNLLRPALAAIPVLNFGIQVSNPRFEKTRATPSISSSSSSLSSSHDVLSPLLLRAWTSCDNMEAFRTLHVSAHKTWCRPSPSALLGLSSIELLADINVGLTARTKPIAAEADSFITSGCCRCTSIGGGVALRVTYCAQDQRTCIATCGVLKNGSSLHAALRYALTEQVSVSLGCESRLPNMWKCVHGGGVAKLAHAMWDSWSGLLNDVRIGIEIS